MQSAIFAVVGQRLVARVNDRAVELHPLINVVHDVIRALADLKVDPLFRGRNVKVEGERIGLPDPPSTGKNLAGGEKGEERAKRGWGELRLTFHEIILVATEGRAGVVIDVVFDERNLTGYA